MGALLPALAGLLLSCPACSTRCWIPTSKGSGSKVDRQKSLSLHHVFEPRRDLPVSLNCHYPSPPPADLKYRPSRRQPCLLPIPSRKITQPDANPCSISRCCTNLIAVPRPAQRLARASNRPKDDAYLNAVRLSPLTVPLFGLVYGAYSRGAFCFHGLSQPRYFLSPCRNTNVPIFQ